MEILIVVLVALAVLVLVGATFVVGRRRGAPPAEAPDTTVLEAPAPEAPTLEEVVEEAAAPVGIVEPAVRPTFRERLAKARSAMAGYIGSVLSRGVDPQTWEELEEALVVADVGIETATSVLATVRERAEETNETDPAAIVELLKAELKREIGDMDRTLHLGGAPSIWLFVGVNGVGKTTTIGKLARRQVDDGRTVTLAAGDTFRAAAGSQLEMWAERSDSEIIRGADGADPSSVIFDAVEHAAARGADLVLADTAGRLHTKSNLMEELRKVRRVADRGAGTVTEVLLVLDATTGQNGLVQARQFTEAVEVSGVVLTKLDGSAKGGIVIAVQSELGIPVKLVGLGEGIADLVEFDPDQFVEALFA